MERMTQKIVRLLTSQKISGESDEAFFNRIYYELRNPDYLGAGLEVNRNVSRLWAGSFLNANWGSGYITNNSFSLPLSAMPQGIKNFIADDFALLNNAGSVYQEAYSIIQQAFEYERNRTAEILAAEQAERDRIAALAYAEQQAALAAAAAAERLRLQQQADAEAQARAEAERIAIIKAAEERNLVTVEQQNTMNVYEVIAQSSAEIKKNTDIIIQAKETISGATGIPKNEIPVTIQQGNLVTTDSIMSLLTGGAGENTANLPAVSENLKSTAGGETSPQENANQSSLNPLLIGGALWILKKFF